MSPVPLPFSARALNLSQKIALVSPSLYLTYMGGFRRVGRRRLRGWHLRRGRGGRTEVRPAIVLDAVGVVHVHRRLRCRAHLAISTSDAVWGWVSEADASPECWPLWVCVLDLSLVKHHSYLGSFLH